MNCDRLAPWYRWLEYGAFGRALERRRNAFLPRVQTARRALLLGDGDGRFAARLLAARGQETAMELTCVDRSAGMLELARCRLQRHPGRELPAEIEFVHAEARDWLRARGALASAGAVSLRFDLIVTHFFLDCFSAEELPKLVHAIAAVADTDARWLISEVRQPSGNGPRAWHAAAWIYGLYGFFRWATGLRVSRLPDHRPSLVANGFSLVASETARAGLLVSEFWQRPA